MNKQLSKRAIEGRKWRINAREKRRLNTIVTRYIEEKHGDIYQKCKEFYNKVVEKYSTVQNLTKTEEFRFFLNENAASDNEQATTSNSNEQATTSNSNKQATTSSSNEQATTSNSNEQTTTSNSNEQATTSSSNERATTSNSNEQATTSSSNEQATTSNSNEQMVALGIGPDILSEAVCEIGEIGENNIQLDNMDIFVNDIIRELEAGEPSIFGLLDEGIELNAEDELCCLVEQYDPL